MTNNILPYYSTAMMIRPVSSSVNAPQVINTDSVNPENPGKLQNGSMFIRSYYPQVNGIQAFKSSKTNNNVINESLDELEKVEFLPGDLEHMESLGVNPIFNNGKEARELIEERGIKVEFGHVDGEKCHAQWNNDTNTIVINDKYKNTKDKAIIFAISEAIFHEAGHAKDADGETSIQEEFDCLALNTLANRYHQKYYPEVFKSSPNADILNDGVCLYSKLFFDDDPDKTALAKRIIKVYGDLPLESPNHKTSMTARLIYLINTDPNPTPEKKEMYNHLIEISKTGAGTVPDKVMELLGA